MLSPETLSQHIDQAAQQCVKCGLCLPHCPTYQVAKNENESPRGRIALMQGAVRQQVPVTEKLKYHLDTCLACRACEAVCPAQVPYETLITSTRAWLTIKKFQKPIWLERALIFIFENPLIRKFFGKLLKFYPKYSIAPSTIQSDFLSQSITPTKGKVLLFSSCAHSVFDQSLTQEAIHLLTALGWEVKSPTPQYCCGALALHAGKLSEAQSCAQQQVAQWNKEKPDFIVTLANGCHATLQEYENAPLEVDTPKIPLMTIEAFLLKELNENPLPLKPLPERIMIHTPCTLRNAIRQPHITLQLLQKIPELTCIECPVTISGCCGAAGSYFLRHKEIASQLVSPIVQFTAQQEIQALATTNIGCAIHMQHALKEAGMNITVLHPLSIIAKQL